MDERTSGVHQSSSKPFTARRCSAVDSGAGIITAGRLPGPPATHRRGQELPMPTGTFPTLHLGRRGTTHDPDSLR
jgi:hypothetical protein